MRNARLHLLLLLLPFMMPGRLHANQEVSQPPQKQTASGPASPPTNTSGTSQSQPQAPVTHNGGTGGDIADVKDRGTDKPSKNDAEPPRMLKKYGVLVPFLVALIPLFGSIWIFFKTKAVSGQIADRTVRIEAQKLLLEINKQYVSNPALLGIYDEHFEKLSFEERNSSKLRMSILAMAYMKMNVFEIVFAVHPRGSEKDAWVRYFRDTFEKCSPFREAFCKYKHLYSRGVIQIYNEITSDSLEPLQCPEGDTSQEQDSKERPKKEPLIMILRRWLGDHLK